MDKSVRITSGCFNRIFFIAIAIITGILFITAEYPGMAIFAGLFFALTLVCIFLLSGYAEASDRRILISTPPIGKFAIPWDEVTHIEVYKVFDGAEFTFYFGFYGENKRLGFSTQFLNGDIEGLLTIISNQAQTHHIPVQSPTEKMHTRPKNTWIGWL
ncbi:MAG TPA: hypothetical protein VLK33_08280 [Terriglobales bacterium]|nr:hypothetical protein [Terriglobales bacterium]